MKNPKILLGAHLYISKGLAQAVYNAQILECNTLQIFTHSNRQWNIKDLNPTEINLFKKAQEETKINEIVCHSSYLINLGSDNSYTIEQSIKCLQKELNICDQLNIKYLVLHPGSGSNPDKCIEKIIFNLNKIFDNYKGKTTLLIENMAGQGNTIGNKFEQLFYILKNINYNYTGICFDTCHAWAAGYDFSTQETYEQIFYKTIDINKIKLFH